MTTRSLRSSIDRSHVSCFQIIRPAAGRHARRLAGTSAKTAHIWRYAAAATFVAFLGLFIIASDRPAQAASFDCGKAELPLDKLICTTPELSAKDDEMAAKYKAALAILSPKGQGILRDGQRKWVKFVRTYCTSRIGKLADGGNDDARQCLVTEYDARLAGLSFAAVKTGGFIFSRVDDFEIWPSVAGDDNGSRPGFGYCDIEYPRIDDPQTSEAVAWNKKWAEWGNQCVIPHLTTDPNATNADMEVGFRINMVRDGFIGITGTTGQYDHGAAHGIGLGDGDEQWNLVFPGFRSLAASDLFQANSGWRQLLIQRCMAVLSKNLTADQLKEIAGWDQDCINPAGWVLSPDNLMISFDLNDAIGYGAGIAEVDIPWSDLKPYLTPDAPIKLPVN